LEHRALTTGWDFNMPDDDGNMLSLIRNYGQGRQKGPKKSVKVTKSNTTPVLPKINWNRERKEEHLKVDTQEHANDPPQNKAKVRIGFDDL
jgi:hypothetical protein